MAIKSIQMYRKNLDGTETRLNPLTEAQYVSMENGQTVQEVLSDRDSDKYTPVITNSSSTFKVGQGDNVDLSSSMKEGAYDSCVLKGKTMVNCIQEPSSKDVVLPYVFEDGQSVTINDTKESGALGVELKGQTLVNLATKTWAMGSTAQFNKDTITLTTNTDKAWFSTTLKTVGMKAGGTYLLYTDSITYDASLSSSSNLVSLVSLYEMKPNRNVGKFISNGAVKVTIPSDVDASDIGIRIHATLDEGTGGVGKTTTVKGLMIFEYQEGMENWNIPYFEGMTSCKMPTLHTVGKNLFDLTNAPNGYLTTNNPYALASPDHNNKTSAYIKVKPNTKYSYSFDGFTPSQVGNMYWTGFYYYKRIGEVSTAHPSRMTFTSNSEANKQITFTTPSDCNYIRIGSRGLMLDGATVQLEEATSATTYEQHKSSILSLPEEVVLRSLPNGVCDTFNTRTGVYTQMVQEFVFDGSDDEGWVLTNSSTSHETMIAFEVKDRDYMNNLNKHNNQPLLNNLFRVYTDKSWNYFDDEHFRQWGNGSSISWVCVIPRSKLSSVTVEGFKSWLSKNPMKVVAKLKTPIVTKINLPSTLKSWNTTTHIYSEIPENTLYPTLSHVNPSYPAILKPSTKYSIVANSYSNSHANSAINFNLGGATASTTVGNRVTTITTPSTLSNELLTMSGRGNKLNNVMVIEGDVAGDEPYFEGICDCKSPILSNVGKNLVNVDNYVNYPSENIPIVKDGENSYIIENKKVGSWQNRCVDKIKLKANTTYTLSYDSEVLSASVPMVYATVLNLRNDLDTSINVSGDVSPNNPRTFTPTQDMLVRLCMYATDTSGGTNRIKFSNIQLEESSSRTTYEPHKSNTTTFDQKDDKTIVLRSLPNGVCDTLNVETGEYVQRIGDYTVNGTETSWFTYIDTTGVNNNYLNQTSCAFGFHLTGKVKGNGILCDKLPTRSIGWWASGNTGEGICGIDNDNRIFLRVKNEKTGVLYTDNVSTALGKAKAYFTNNPVTVQYELATPIVSTIDVQGFPYAYTNGHVQLSSGSIEQSLTPKVEYSLSANKTGQINSNTKRVSAHQKQLDDFEAMMLTSMVQSAYDKAILQFDYEMQMMSLGGE